MLLISRVVLLAALGVLAISFFVTPLPDWAVRVDGVLVMIPFSRRLLQRYGCKE